MQAPPIRQPRNPYRGRFLVAGLCNACSSQQQDPKQGLCLKLLAKETIWSMQMLMSRNCNLGILTVTFAHLHIPTCLNFQLLRIPPAVTGA